MLTSYFQLEASSIAMRQNMLHDRLVLPAVNDTNSCKAPFTCKEAPEKIFPSEIFFKFSELSRCYNVC